MLSLRLRTAICLLSLIFILPAFAFAQQFKVGFAKVDITPKKPTPMWGYGVRHDMLSKGVQNPLYAKAVVIDVGDQKLALVGLDLGRSLGEPQYSQIKQAIKKDSGVTALMMVGSHTHSGPVLELKDEPGKGKGKFDYAVKYVGELEQNLIDVINEAAKNVQDARIGWGSMNVDMNRNRQAKKEPKPRDTELAVVRFDDLNGKPIAILTNFAAHPTMLNPMDCLFSSEWPGQMQDNVEKDLHTNCMFMQGAAGDMSVKTTPKTNTIETYGKAMAGYVEQIAKGIQTKVPEHPSIQCMEKTYAFKTRIDFRNKAVQQLLAKAFFPELAHAFLDDVKDDIIRPHLTVVLLNKQLALVGGSGEFFCNHSNRLKARSGAEKTLFFGYCNGHHMYFPTIEQAAQGGYGADAQVSWVSLGAGEEMMNDALIDIYVMLGKLTREQVSPL